MTNYIVNANGALPSDVNFFPESPKTESKSDSLIIAELTEEIILLKKQLRRAKREADAWKIYVPQELVNHLVTHSPEVSEKKSLDAGQMTDD